MQDVLAQLERWLDDGERAALATVVGARRSAPRPLGSRLAISETGAMLGSVSGGCVEADVAREAQQALADGRPRLLTYGIEDETAQAVGLPCGGEIDVFVAPIEDAGPIRRIREAVARGERATLSTVLAGDRAGEMELSSDGAAGRQPAVEERDGANVFVEPLRPPPLLVCVGATDLAEALTRLAADLGWRTAVTDARPALLTRERLPSAGALIRGWPDETLEQAGVGDDTAVVVLSHDEKLDVPALARALRSDAFYVGALGSRRRQETLRRRLEEAGVEDTSRLAGPAGLDLGAHAVAETALSILAEVVAVREGKAGGRLRDAEAAIHA
ncbi:MAG TPA: XdhC family protein [Gaiellaceae bacterium]|nr:XdhC family protein [Gaiellaceae bacterium]